MRSVVVLAMLLLTDCASIPSQKPLQSRFDYSDVLRFYRVYDAYGGKPDAATLQHEYLDPGSQALKEFVPYRIYSAERLAQRIAEAPAVYDRARACMTLMKGTQAKFARIMRRFVSLYPEAKQVDLTFVIGRNSSGGTVTDAGVILGLEVICRSDAPSALPLARRLEALAAHEIAHASQPAEPADTLLQAAIREGVPELVAELTVGEISNDHLMIWTKGKEAEIERRFRTQLDSKDLKEWLYQGPGTAEKPGDLAYWVGYRIAKSYYDRASDKHAALKRLLTDPDVKGILRDSDWLEGPRLGHQITFPT